MIGVAGVGYLFLGKAAFDRPHHAAHRIQLAEIIERALLHIEGQPFHKIGAAQRVDGIGYAGFVGQDLLGTQGDAGRIFRR